MSSNTGSTIPSTFLRRNLFASQARRPPAGVNPSPSHEDLGLAAALSAADNAYHTEDPVPNNASAASFAKGNAGLPRGSRTNTVIPRNEAAVDGFGRDAAESRRSEDDEIVVKDSNGLIVGHLTMTMPSHVVQDMDPIGEDEDSVRFEQQRRAESRLIELYRSHSQMDVDPTEIQQVIEKSLLEKVASLEEDKWMFEVEENTIGRT